MPLDNGNPRAYAMDMQGDTLRRIRILRGMTQEDLGTAAGMRQVYVSVLENNHRKPGPRTLKRLADALGCSIADLVGE